MKSKTVVIANGKGGVNKSSVAQALTSILNKKKGKETLFIEMDPQSSSSKTFNLSFDFMTIAEVLEGEADINDAIQETEYGDMIPADVALAGLKLRGTNLNSRLREKLKDLKKDYSMIIIDTPPNLGTCTILALYAADTVIIPSLATSYSKDGVEELRETIETIKEEGNKNIEVAGIVLSTYEGRLKQSKQIKEELEKIAAEMGTKIFDQTIRKAVVVDQAQQAHKTVLDFAPKHPVTKDYENFVDEFLKGDK